MKRFTKIASLVLIGFVIGASAGYLFANSGSDASTPIPNHDAFNIAIPRDFFAKLPTSEDGKHRLVAVESFTFTGPDSKDMKTGDEIVLPRFGIASVAIDLK